MAIVGKILLGLLWAVLGLLGLVLLLLLAALLIPASVELHYAPDGFRARLRVLFYTRQLFPKPPPMPKRKSFRVKIKKKKAAHKKRISAANGVKPPRPEKPVQQEEQQKEATMPPETEKASPPPPPQADAQPQSPPSEQAPKPEKAEKSDTAKKEGPKRTEKFKDTLGKLSMTVRQAGAIMRAVLRSLHFVHIRLIVPVHERMPDQTARVVGRTNAWLYGIASMLEPRLHLKWDEVRIVPDYDDQYADRLLLELTVRGNLLPIAIAALRAYIVLKQEKIF